MSMMLGGLTTALTTRSMFCTIVFWSKRSSAPQKGELVWQEHLKLFFFSFLMPSFFCKWLGSWQNQKVFFSTVLFFLFLSLILTKCAFQRKCSPSVSYSFALNKMALCKSHLVSKKPWAPLKKKKKRKKEGRQGKKAFLFFEPRASFAKREDLEPRNPGIWFNLNLDL